MAEIRAKTKDAQRLLQAASDGNIEVLKERSHHELRTTVCTSGCSALHWAAGCNQMSVLDYLVLERDIPADLPAVKKSRGRTPLHYACRNGCIEAARWLVCLGGADPEAAAKHGVTPFQLAVWQNRLEICQWLVEECRVDPAQVNDFACGAVHWLGICPILEADLIPMAEWLSQQTGGMFQLKQRQGHTPLHKATWGGHLLLIQYLHERHNLWDDCQDEAGNFAADLADMANTPRHKDIASYLRNNCSRARAKSCALLGIDTSATTREIRKAYLDRAKEIHPDRRDNFGKSNTYDVAFDVLHKAYRHLMDEGGRGSQSNPTHSLKRMLQVNSRNVGNQAKEPQDSICFKARLIAVLLEYGNKGLDLSNVKRKWNQVWPDQPFPDYQVSLSEYILSQAGDAVDLVKDNEKGTLRVLAKHHTKQSVAQALLVSPEER